MNKKAAGMENQTLDLWVDRQTATDLVLLLPQSTTYESWSESSTLVGSEVKRDNPAKR